MGNCCCGDTKPIEVYVELCGKENFHVSLKGRDEADQHPITAITHLRETLDNLDDDIAEVSTRLDEEIVEREKIHIENYYNKEEIDEKVDRALRYKGQVTNYESLPIVGNVIGDVYNVVDTGANYVWTGNSWDDLSPAHDLSDYVTKEYFEGTLNASIKLIQDHLQAHYYEKFEVDDLISNVEEQINDINTEALTSFNFRGSKVNYRHLPHNAKVGDTYILQDTSDIYFWDGNVWTLLQCGVIIDAYSKEEVDTLLAGKADVGDMDNVEQSIETLSAAVDDLEESMAEKLWFDLNDIT